VLVRLGQEDEPSTWQGQKNDVLFMRLFDQFIFIVIQILSCAQLDFWLKQLECWMDGYFASTLI
jgi:hypothetical protein